MPPGIETAPLQARIAHPKLGQLLFFDPTDDLTPLGKLTGALQANFGLLVTPEGGELLELPRLSTDSNGIERTAKLTLDEDGNAARGRARDSGGRRSGLSTL